MEPLFSQQTAWDFNKYKISYFVYIAWDHNQPSNRTDNDIHRWS